jgi:hypothetical protein
VALLTEGLAQPAKSVGTLPLLSAAQKRELFTTLASGELLACWGCEALAGRVGRPTDHASIAYLQGAPAKCPQSNLSPI